MNQSMEWIGRTFIAIWGSLGGTLGARAYVAMVSYREWIKASIIFVGKSCLGTPTAAAH